MGSGVGWIDYNNDGCRPLLRPRRPVGRETAEGGPLPTCKLYRNNGDGTFTDVTKEVGLDRPALVWAAPVADFDNDGFDDLVVTYVGGLVLYHNEPDGKGGRRFVDVTSRAGLRDPHWAPAAPGRHDGTASSTYTSAIMWRPISTIIRTAPIRLRGSGRIARCHFPQCAA